MEVVETVDVIPEKVEEIKVNNESETTSVTTAELASVSENEQQNFDKKMEEYAAEPQTEAEKQL